MGMRFRKLRNSLIKRYRHLRCKLSGGRRILILGDSHAGVFEYIFDNGLLLPHVINCEIVGGATAYGLNNEASSTGAFRKFQEGFHRFEHYDVIVVMLGEVDCSSALWLKATKENRPAGEYLSHSMQGVRRLVDWIRRQEGKRKLVLAGSILPTVKDSQLDNQALEARRKIRVGQRARTDLVLRFNEELRNLAATLDVSYMDITAPTLDPETGLVIDDVLVQGRVDHHHSQSETAAYWVSELRRVLADCAEFQAHR
ncbi:MAG: hypothetical protein M0P39_11145 [Rhodocyclaceae bacterium]|nr:hypothetical protein [Rhodocyclaceae bacterium]